MADVGVRWRGSGLEEAAQAAFEQGAAHLGDKIPHGGLCRCGVPGRDRTGDSLVELERLWLRHLYLAGESGPSGEHLRDDLGQCLEGVVVAGFQDEPVEGDVVVEIGGDVSGGSLGADRGSQRQQAGALFLGGSAGGRSGGDRLDGGAQLG